MQEKNNRILNNFSARFSSLIKESGVTQLEVAKKIGVSQAAINFYKNGRNMPGGEELYKISKLFGASIDWLITGIESMSEDSATQMWRDRALRAEEKLEIARETLKGALKKILK